MATDAQAQQERFQILLQHIQFPEDKLEPCFEKGRIEKLQLNKTKQQWRFHFHFPDKLSAEAYRIFAAKLEQTFAHIARVDMRFHFHNVPLKDIFDEYWPVFISEHRQRLNGLHKRLSQQPPKCHQNELTFSLLNEIERQLCNKKLEPLIEHFYARFLIDWKPRFVYEVDTSEEEMNYQQFMEAREEEDRVRAAQTLKEMEEGRKQQVDSRSAEPGKGLLIGYEIKDEPVSMDQIEEEERRICMQGYVFKNDIRELKSGRSLLLFDITDYSESFSVKMFSRDKEHAASFAQLKEGMWVKVRGSVQTDTFQNELVMMANDIQEISVKEREDESEEKRIELHLHSNMSTMDGLSPISAYVEQAAKWGHQALAVTDHGVVQAFPEAHAASKKHGLKMLYGMEAYLVDDGVPIVYEPQARLLTDETYIVFDVETTGLSAVYNQIIELAAVKIHRGEIVERFERFANPHEPISDKITQLTGITDDMVKDAPEIDEVLHDFLSFIQDHTLVAHNASFDMGFLHVGYKALNVTLKNPVLDTLELGRLLYPELKNHRLNTLCKKFNIPLENHHRAVDDAEATAYLSWKMIKDAHEKGIQSLEQLNEQKGMGGIKRNRPTHCTILAQNKTGLKNLYKLISFSHLRYFHRFPRIPRSVLTQHREGLLIGSACDQGEVFEGVMQKSPEAVEQTAQFYDYLEIQPVANYEHLLRRELVKSKEHIQEILMKIVRLGKKLGKPVVATGNVHYVHPQDAIHREILVTTLGRSTYLKADELPPVHFRTTTEMLDEFSFLGGKTAREVVIDNTHHIAAQIEDIEPVPDGLYTPNIEGADQEMRDLCYAKAKSIYGDPLPDLVEKRLETELESIISNGFAVIYLISHKLVKKSLFDGYLVGSRGSVGSSFVATMSDITEVNPLPPHYVCTECHYVQFFDDGSVGSGFDLQDQDCPQCGTKLVKDGHDIPFETFLGFNGDKVPDIDLNFSGDYQPVAHKYTQELFGEEKVFRAGTIGTVADKTAFGFVKKYEEEQGKVYRTAEINRLAKGCTGVKRTTGQHPGGIIVVPEEKDIFDFTPIQYPADDTDSEWRTTHFDFNSIHDNLLKLDILGHDDPTVIRMLQDLSGIDPETIPTDDPQVMEIFSSTRSLGVTEEQIMSKTGTYGIPEFGTRFVRQMLEDTRPTTFSELVRISGLSHGSDVWLNNAEELIRKKITVLSEVISTRDDIMVYLIHKGLDHSRAFQIMEKVRKGKGLTEEEIDEMKAHGVPDWYIWSCKQIKYMFPKAHATAYVLMAVRIAYFKIYHPLYFYASYFTVRADDFDVALVLKGSSFVRKQIEDILEKGNQASPKEKGLLTVLELCLEMLERGFHFHEVDLYQSRAGEFLVKGNGLLPPLDAIPGVGTNAARNIVKAREDGEFLSKEDLQTRSKTTKTVMEHLEAQGCLSSLPETNQLSLF